MPFTLVEDAVDFVCFVKPGKSTIQDGRYIPDTWGNYEAGPLGMSTYSS
jgi:hypothetical protein